MSSISFASSTELPDDLLAPQDYDDYVLNFKTNHEVTIIVTGIGEGNIDCAIYTHTGTHVVDIDPGNNCYLKISPWLKRYYLRIKNNGTKNSSYLIVAKQSKLTNI